MSNKKEQGLADIDDLINTLQRIKETYTGGGSIVMGVANINTLDDKTFIAHPFKIQMMKVSSPEEDEEYVAVISYETDKK